MPPVLYVAALAIAITFYLYRDVYVAWVVKQWRLGRLGRLRKRVAVMLLHAANRRHD